MTNAYFDKLEDYRDIESINFLQNLQKQVLMTPEYMMKCLMLRRRDNARTPMQWDDSPTGWIYRWNAMDQGKSEL